MEGSDFLPTREYPSQSAFLISTQIERNLHWDVIPPECVFEMEGEREVERLCLYALFLLCSAQADSPLMSDDWAPLQSSCYGYQPGSVYMDTHRNFDLQWSTDGRARVPQNHLPTHMHIHTIMLRHAIHHACNVYAEKHTWREAHSPSWSTLQYKQYCAAYH